MTRDFYDQEPDNTSLEEGNTHKLFKQFRQEKKQLEKKEAAEKKELEYFKNLSEAHERDPQNLLGMKRDF